MPLQRLTILRQRCWRMHRRRSQTFIHITSNTLMSLIRSGRKSFKVSVGLASSRVKRAMDALRLPGGKWRNFHVQDTTAWTML